MTVQGLHHVAIAVPDLARAERYYRDLFEMAVLYREGHVEGRYGRLPDGIDWPTAAAHGVEPGTTYLRRDEFVLSLEASVEDGDSGPLDRIALRIDLADLASITSRAAEMGCGVDERESGAEIVDRYGLQWVVTAEPFPPRSRFDDLAI
jgi:catechol 2,3-dioxygenase-like lactoylglutathione lyase family enzyme